MIELVITGGQTGADQAGWRAAKAAGIATGGWMPKGFQTEAGSRPEFAWLFNAREMPNTDYPARTRANVNAADLTLWFGESGTPGYRCTVSAARQANKTFQNNFWGHARNRYDPSVCAYSIQNHHAKVINVAGNRESKSPGIGSLVEAYLAEVFAILRQSIPATQQEG